MSKKGYDFLLGRGFALKGRLVESDIDEAFYEVELSSEALAVLSENTRP